ARYVARIEKAQTPIISGARHVQIPEFLVILFQAHSHALTITDIDFHDERLNQHLRQHYVELRNDVADHREIVFIGKYEQGIGTFVRNDLGVGNRRIFTRLTTTASSSHRAVDGVVQPVTKPGSATAPEIAATGGSRARAQRAA